MKRAALVQLHLFLKTENIFGQFLQNLTFIWQISAVKLSKELTDVPGYDAEAVVSPDGKKIVFTSTRTGDLELWTMDIDGKNLKQLTFGLGYDGGAFFSHDSKKNCIPCFSTKDRC